MGCEEHNLKAAQVADLWEHDKDLLMAEPGDVEASPLHKVVAGGILCVTGTIPFELQMALLTRGGEVEINLISERVLDAVKLCSLAIQTLAAGSGERLNLKAPGLEGPIQQEIKTVQKQFER